MVADAVDVVGAIRQSPIEFVGIRDLIPAPKGSPTPRRNTHRSKFALRAVAMLHGGVDPGLLDEVQW
jgi:hypothetical protein